jgi:hypothetical protein
MNGTTSSVAVTEGKTAPWRRIFRIFRWTTYATVLVAILMIMHAAPPPPVVTSSQAAGRAEQKLQDVEQAVSAGQPATLRLDETELNSFLASHLDISSNAAASAAPPPSAPTPSTPAGTPPADIEQARSSVRDVKVQLIEDRVRAYVVFDFHGKDMTLQLEGRLGASDGYLRFEPVSGQLGALPIPQSTLDAAVRRMMDSPENREKLRLPAEMSDLKIENGEIIASYK